MSTDEITTLLKQDFDTLSGNLESDGFERRLLFKIGSRDRARMGIVGIAGGLGAALAASQFANLGNLLAPYFTDSASPLVANNVTIQIAGAMVLGACTIATALVLRKDA